MIQVSELTKRFGLTLAVDGLSFEVEPGEILGFLGPNGAGKTTTLRILTGFFPPSRGTASIGGHDVVEEPMAARAQTGYLPENVPLYVDMRVGEYLRFVAGVKGLGGLEARREAGRVMEAVGIADREGQLIRQLSKGYRQRVGLAQAMVGDPPVLILDEPTIGLDPRQIVEIRELIKGFAGVKTVVLSSHILPEVAATCSRVVIINQGRLVAQGPPELLQPGGPGQAALCLSVRGASAEAVGEVVGRVPGISGVRTLEPVGQPGEVCALTLDTSGGLEPRAAVAKAVVEAGYDLVELKPAALSLEEVFVQLITEEKTKQEGEAA